MTMTTHKRKQLNGAGLTLQRFSPMIAIAERGAAPMSLERKLRVLHLHSGSRKRERTTELGLGF